MKRLLVTLLAAASCGITFGQTNPLPLGSISNIQSATCPTGFVKGAICSTATVSCPNLTDLSVTYGTHGTPTNGTVIFINGDGATLPYGNGFAAPYLKAGLSSVQFAFAQPWEEVGSTNVMNAACRPATVLNYFYQAGIPYAVQSASAGSGAVAYALSWYGMAGEFKNWEAVVGPVFSDIAQGCELPWSAGVTVIPTNGAAFVDPVQYNNEFSFMTTSTGEKCLPKTGTTSAAVITAWQTQSILAPGAQLNFPGLNISSWVCNNGLNPSAAQAYLFLSQVTSPWSLTTLSGCTGAEGIGTGVTPQLVLGIPAITADMILQMVP